MGALAKWSDPFPNKFVNKIKGKIGIVDLETLQGKARDSIDKSDEHRKRSEPFSYSSYTKGGE